ncbi:hypothetical protein RFI_30722 [Reticulomyxa filosa]|uniref:Transmembrane protein n=1 Tax=Reticulomyxa filosa TaxID=46433 RepID=X6M114_RETFI|nr:hypothetical protein RFI_30722 [Reticulomyxa filosa]|eukprot:ETO06670.1 hypothetical protein RFI_30722 [Reticulomyxa filosa]
MQKSSLFDVNLRLVKKIKITEQKKIIEMGDKISPLFSYAFVFLLSSVLLGVFLYPQSVVLPTLSEKPASTKPYGNFSDFWPYYMTEHSTLICQRYHIVGTTIVATIFAISPQTMISVGNGMLAGYLSFPIFRGMEFGAAEAAVMCAIALICGHMLKCKKYILLCALVGYGCAWVGHFVYEHNKPATFIYPSFSLMSDWKLWALFWKKVIVETNFDLLYAWNTGVSVPLIFTIVVLTPFYNAPLFLELFSHHPLSKKKFKNYFEILDFLKSLEFSHQTFFLKKCILDFGKFFACSNVKTEKLVIFKPKLTWNVEEISVTLCNKLD